MTALVASWFAAGVLGVAIDLWQIRKDLRRAAELLSWPGLLFSQVLGCCLGPIRLAGQLGVFGPNLVLRILDRLRLR